ncbi:MULTISPECIES: hypothetical protein [Halorussus]|uniref:hypothetical protein n=1 Tax=Halorussus TaxID=1070314 RepID=UPI00209EE160|nr:hypothetical protein [Halorussus vallis]
MSEENHKKRRSVLQSLAVSAAGAGVSVSLLPGLASARYPISTSGTIDDPDWQDYEQYVKENELGSTSTSSVVSPERVITPSDISIPNPVDFGFDVCGTFPEGRLCVATGTQTKTSYYDCASKEIRTVSFTVTKQTYDIYGNLQAEFKQSAWIGVYEQGCLQLGVSSAGQNACVAIRCPWDPSPASTLFSARQEITPIAEDVIDWLNDNTSIYLSPGSAAYVVALGLIVALIYLLFIAGSAAV